MVKKLICKKLKSLNPKLFVEILKCNKEFSNQEFTSEQIETIKNVYHILYDSSLNVTQAKEKIINEFPGNPLAKDVVDFIDRSKRGILGK